MNTDIVTDDMFLQRITGYCRQESILQRGERALVALSGGADSVCLLLVLMRMRVPVVAAHCNFHLRGEESMRDEHFVRELCTRLHVSLVTTDFDVDERMRLTGDSVEMACRNLRYEWFERMRVEHGCDVVAVAHHADDNVETFLLNAVRGTGIAGLSAIHPVNGRIVRPLLCVSRSSIVSWLDACHQPFVVDSTNLENDVKRNRLRNAVLPVLYSQLPEARRTLPLTISHVNDCYALYCESVAKLSLIVAPGYSLDSDFAISATELLSFAKAGMLLYEMLRPMGFNRSQCESALAALASDGGEQKEFKASAHTLVVKGDSMRVLMAHRAVAPVCDEFRLHLADGVDITSPIRLKVAVKKGTGFSPAMCNGRTVIALDSQVLDCHNVVLRHWRQADRFRPFGMRGSRLLSDLFSDLHLDAEAKRNVWILEADGEILWIIGYRASAHYAVKPGNSRSFVLLSVLE